MSSLSVSSSSQGWSRVQLLKHPWWRSLTLLVLLAFSVAICLLVMSTTPQGDALTLTFMHMWMIGFLPYVVGCTCVLITKPAGGHWLFDQHRLCGFLACVSLVCFRIVALDCLAYQATVDREQAKWERTGDCDGLVFYYCCAAWLCLEYSIWLAYLLCHRLWDGHGWAVSGSSASGHE
jgi:hypothetical protein